MKMRHTKISSHMKFYPHHQLYHIPLPEDRKLWFGAQKSLRVLKLLRVLIDRVLFRLFSDRFPFRVLSDRVVFKSSVIGFSSGFSVISWVISALFLACRYLFIKSCCYFLSLKTDDLFYIIFSEGSTRLTIR